MVIASVIQIYKLSSTVVHKTRSGQLIMNDTFQQVGIYEIPFGGCGESGRKFHLFTAGTHIFDHDDHADGSYMGKHSFDSFTHLRGSINVPFP
jgi:aldehyde dehydrogenase (NAD+)